MLSVSDLRKKYLGAPEATDEDMQIVRAVREYVDFRKLNKYIL